MTLQAMQVVIDKDSILNRRHRLNDNYIYYETTNSVHLHYAALSIFQMQSKTT